MSNFPQRIQNIITAPIDPSLIKEKDGGKDRNGNQVKLKYVSGMTVIDILNKAFDYNWDWVTEKEWVQDSVPYFNKWNKEGTDIFEGKKGAWESQNPVAHVRGVLTAHFEDDNGVMRSISKTGYGAQPIVGKQSEQESAFKSADTDALKKAASRLGVAAELYRSEEEQAFFYASLPTSWTDTTLEFYNNHIQFLYKKLEELGEASFNETINAIDNSLHALADINPTNIEIVCSTLGYNSNGT